MLLGSSATLEPSSFENSKRIPISNLTGATGLPKRMSPSRSTEETDSNKPLVAVSAPRRIAISNHPYRLSPELPEHWGRHVIPLVLDQLSIPIGRQRHLAQLDFLPDLYREATEDSCLYLTTKAAFLTYMARRNPHAFSAKAAGKAYGRALSSVNASLRDPSTYLRDDTIAAIWLQGVNIVGLSESEPNVLRLMLRHSLCKALLSWD